VLSLGYVSLHEQRKVTRSEGAKAFAVDVAVAVTFDNKKNNSTRASSALQIRGRCHLHERPWIPA
jgi:hypothetical protein